jgi:hypothetical protein
VSGCCRHAVEKPQLAIPAIFRHWDNNAAHGLLPYWGVTAPQAAAEIAHSMWWDRYRERVVDYIADDYEKPVDAPIEAEIYSHFARDTDEMDAAILIAKHFRWKFISRFDNWVSPLERRIKEMEERSA